MPPQRAGRHSKKTLAKAKIQLAYNKRFLPKPDCTPGPDLASDYNAFQRNITYEVLMAKCRFLHFIPESKGNIMYNQLHSGRQPDLESLVRHFQESELEDREWSEDNWYRLVHKDQAGHVWPENDAYAAKVSKGLTWVCRHSGYCNVDGGVPLALCYSIFLSTFQWRIKFLHWMSIIAVASADKIRFEWKYPMGWKTRCCAGTCLAVGQLT